ncbi:unnamed protein product, partial [Schistocephalus solidus]|uniref:Dynein light chain Tctex-type 1 n=1 Tax=Schistocephalus solidus TaxID=70667 RepID=A0A183TH23_SCHSO
QAAAFSSIEAAAVLKDTVALCLGKHEFCPSKIEQWTSGIIDQCLIQLAKLNRPFKYIVTCVIMQKNGTSLHTASSCYWDTNTDGKFSRPFSLTRL